MVSIVTGLIEKRCSFLASLDSEDTGVSKCEQSLFTDLTKLLIIRLAESFATELLHDGQGKK